MGCGSQTGCLGPKPREREVYLDLVDTIHQEALILQLPQYIFHQIEKRIHMPS